MWPRVLMVLLVLFAPTSSLASTVCCDEAATDSCCGPEGGCPISDDGECALAAQGDTFKTALRGDEPPSLEPGHSEPLAAVRAIAASESPPARELAHIPRHLLLQTLRN